MNVDLPRLGISRIAAIAALVSAMTVAGVLLLGAERAQAAGVVSANGQISGCFKKKGKAKGTLRVVPAGKRCKKGEQRIAWSVQGPAGKDGSQGAPGGTGDPGLESRVTQLESILAGITNLELLDAIAAVADVNALCTQVASVTSTLNALNTAVGGIELGGVIPLGLLLDIPTLPAQLAGFSCP